MAYFDDYGWYTQEIVEGRGTSVEPSNTSTSEETGGLRANWTGYEWVDLPYKSPPEPIPEAPQVPDSITPLSGLLVINAVGLTEQYEAWATSADRTFAERAFLDKAVSWKRDDPVLMAGAAALGLSEEDLDNLFIMAASLGD